MELGRISEPKPLPWWLGQYAFGPLERPWWNLTRLVNKGRGGRGHRCEFTDPEMGALYGHKNGAFMDRMFDVFLSRIDGEA